MPPLPCTVASGWFGITGVEGWGLQPSEWHWHLQGTQGEDGAHRPGSEREWSPSAPSPCPMHPGLVKAPRCLLQHGLGRT